jgi:phospholipid/cholesterol/gamma-HCH transport system permease protein
MDSGADTTQGKEQLGAAVFHLQGRLDQYQAPAIWAEITTSLSSSKPPQLILDFQGVTAVDTTGIATILGLENLCHRMGAEFSLRNMPDMVRQYLGYVKQHTSGAPLVPPPKPQVDSVSRLGERIGKFLAESAAFIEFLGQFLISAPKQLYKTRRLHLGEVFYQVQLMGVGAVPLLVSLSLLLGALMVFQGMGSVQSFGNPALIADMVVIAVTREMAPLLTAVVVSGRTGAALAAELGTMKLNEEIEALTALNFDVTSYLVLPRVFALMLAAPLLTMVADAAGILGGLVTAQAAMQVSPESFLNEAHKIMTASNIYTGLIKGFVFGGFIGLIGCLRGLRTGMGAGSVGIQTTSAVVTSIFVVIFLDTMFSYIFQMYGW